MKTPRYYIDNMVICSKAMAPYLTSDFVNESCVVIDEIAYEAKNSMRIKDISTLKRPVEANDLKMLMSIAENCITKYKLMNIYEGNGDLLLVASALAAKTPKDGQMDFFDEIEPIVVTEEKKIRKVCEEYNLPWLSQADFIKVIKSSALQSLPLDM